MKNLIVLAIGALSLTSFAFEPAMELNDVKCAYWENKNDDPRLAVEFKYSGENNDFADVTISKRMTDSDESWEVISETSEQIMVNDRVFSLGVDDVVVVINRPVPGWNKAKRPNGYLEFRDQGETYKLVCENIKK